MFSREHIELTIAKSKFVDWLPLPIVKGNISHSVDAVISLLIVFGVFWIYGHLRFVY